MAGLRPIDQYYESLPEPAAGCMQALRAYLLNHYSGLSEAWKYRMPFFCYQGKMFCYLWTRKDTGQPYLGIVNGAAAHHPDLIQEQRKKMKIFLIDPLNDLPFEKINAILLSVMPPGLKAQ